MLLNATQITNMYEATNYTPKSERVKTKKDVGVLSGVGIKVLKAVETLKTTNRKAISIYTGVSLSAIDKAIVNLEYKGIVKRVFVRKGSQNTVRIELA